MKYFLGVDVGSSKTHALVVDEQGNSLGFGKAAGGNHQSVGYEVLQTVLQESIDLACQQAGLERSQITGAGFGVAGLDFPSEKQPHMEVISKLGLICPMNVVNDGFNGLLAGATHGVGVNVTAGSSNNCRGRNPAGKEGRALGNGPMYGENAGAVEIVMRCLQMVNYAWTKRIDPTDLTGVFLKAYGAADEMDLLEGFSDGRYELNPYLANQVVEAAAAGDAAACEVMRWAGEELGWLAISVARQIGMEKDEVEIIQSGSVFDAGDLIIQPMNEIVRIHCPRARLKRLHGLPVVGAVILGMEGAGFDGYAIRERMILSANQIS